MKTNLLSLRWRYALRDLWRNKSRTLLVILSIAVGIFAFGLIAGTAGTLSTELPANYQAIQPASATLHAAPFNEKMVESIRRMPQVALAEGRTSVMVQFLLPDKSWHDMQLFALEDYHANQINLVLPYQGAWPPPDHELLIERNSLFLTEAQVGDALLLETSDGHQRTLPIAGLAHDMNQPPAQITGIPYAYVDQETLEWLGLPRTFNELQFVVAQDRFDKAHIDQVAQAAADKFEESGLPVHWIDVPEPGHHFVEEFLPTILLILSTLGVLALILSGFLVVNVITAILTQQIRAVGVMKAIGARTPQIAWLYLRMVFVFGAVALALAIPLGALGAQSFARFIAGQLNFDIVHFELSPSVLLLEIAVGMLAPMLAALYPILVSARITVREAVQDQGMDYEPGGGQGIEPLLQRVQNVAPLSPPLRLSLRNTFRRKGRLVRTLIPLVLGGAIFMSVLSIRASLFRTLEDTLSEQGFDVQIQFTQPYAIKRIESEVTQIDGITAVESWAFRQGVPIRPDGTEGDSVRVFAVPANTQIFTPDLVDGRWLQTADQNTVVAPTSFLADEPMVALGHEFKMRIGDQEKMWRVVGVNQVFQPPIAPAVLYVNQPYFWRILGYTGQTDTIRLLTAKHDAATHAHIVQQAVDRLRAAGIEVSSTRTASEDRTIFTERFNIITVVLMLMSFLLATVGSLGLMGAMGINVLERKREIGVMRAIGASTPAVLQIFLVEGVVIGVISWLGALIVSQPLSRVWGRVVGMTFAKLPLTYVFDLRAPLFWFLIVVVVSALASLLPARNAANLSVRETLAYE
ncbi:MAG: FtsX-like permease family protein [Caldilineaceae bacterium]|nr:FtsX-like permease family protein [Caldilineaceae bacterium]MCB9156528.1 FtsX-like permease family protein [Caldilineaceae bacterium]